MRGLTNGISRSVRIEDHKSCCIDGSSMCCYAGGNLASINVIDIVILYILQTMNRDSQVSSTSGNMNGEDPSSTSGTEGDSLLILKDLNEENPSSSTPVVPDEETPSSSTSAMPDACESPVSSSFDLRSQFHSNSPAYVKWDFDLPPASDGKYNTEYIFLLPC